MLIYLSPTKFSTLSNTPIKMNIYVYTHSSRGVNFAVFLLLLAEMYAKGRKFPFFQTTTTTMCVSF